MLCGPDRHEACRQCSRPPFSCPRRRRPRSTRSAGAGSVAGGQPTAARAPGAAQRGRARLAGAGRAAGTGTSDPARRRDLDGAGNTNPRFAPLRRMARSLNQRRGPIVRRGVASALDRPDTESGADAARELFGNDAGKIGRKKPRTRFESHRAVFRRDGQPDL